MTRTFIIAALSVATFVTTPARAEEHVWQTGAEYTIRFADLDLSQVVDRARLLRRVEFASDRICRNHRSRRQRAICVDDVFRNAMAQAGPALRPVLARALSERVGVAMAAR
jgi:UrcA family protein